MGKPFVNIMRTGTSSITPDLLINETSKITERNVFFII